MKNLSADDIVDALTCKQCRDNLRQIYRAIEKHDEALDRTGFVVSIQQAVAEGERMAVMA